MMKERECSCPSASSLTNYNQTIFTREHEYYVCSILSLSNPIRLTPPLKQDGEGILRIHTNKVSPPTAITFT